MHLHKVQTASVKRYTVQAETHNETTQRLSNVQAVATNAST